MKKLKKWIESSKAKRRCNERKLLMSEFDVAEHGGYLWITHKGVAFEKVSDYASAKEIATLLNRSRTIAVEFEQL